MTTQGGIAADRSGFPREHSRFLARFSCGTREDYEMSLRIAILLVPLLLAACGSTDRKTVIVNPPPDSTTTVDKDGNTHVTPNP